jgi:opacity protein-like surface antigen
MAPEGNQVNRWSLAMRSLLWGIVFGVSAAVSAMPSVGADEIGLDSHLLTPVADDEAFEGQAAGCCDELDADCPSRRFYITGIIGASFGTLQSGGLNTEGDFPNTGRATDSLLTAGAAVGMAFDRANGLLRLEVEGRGRDALQGSTNSFEPPTPSYFYSVRAADGWSVMSNVWRDWYLTERLGFYGGGGIGAGGYRLTVNDTVVSGYGHMGGFAWQAGTGTTYQLTKRTTIDLGYRFFDTVSDSLPLTTIGSGGIPAGSYQSNFYASELLLSVRIYEPFRSRSIR